MDLICVGQVSMLPTALLTWLNMSVFNSELYLEPHETSSCTFTALCNEIFSTLSWLVSIWVEVVLVQTVTDRQTLNALIFSSLSDKVLVSFPRNVNVPPHIRDRSKKYCWHCEWIHVTLCPPLPAQLLKSSALRADGPELHCKPTPTGAPPQEAVAREDSGTGTWWHLAPEV